MNMKTFAITVAMLTLAGCTGANLSNDFTPQAGATGGSATCTGLYAGKTVTTQSSSLQAPWSNVSTTLTLNATAPGGVTSLRYAINSVATQPYSGPIGPLANGKNTISCVVNNATNSWQFSLVVPVDTLAPTCGPAGLQAPQPSGWVRSASWSLAAADAGSGVANASVHDGETTYAFPALAKGPASSASASGTLSTDGIHSLVCTATDLLGHNGASPTYTYKIDATPPTCALAATGTPRVNGWLADASVTVSSSDATSGVSSLTSSTDGGAPRAYGAAFSAPEGNHTLSCTAVDAAGNSASSTIVVQADSTPPTCAPALVPPNAAGWARGGTSINVTSADAGSGIDTVAVATDGGARAPYGGTMAAATSGSHSVRCFATDKAGYSSDATLSYRVDADAPTCVASASQAWYRAPVNVTFTPADTTSGVASATLTQNGGSATPGAPIALTSDGSYAFVCTVTDVAGNSVTVSPTIGVDATSPLVQTSQSTSNGHSVILTGVDQTSLVSYLYLDLGLAGSAQRVLSPPVHDASVSVTITRTGCFPVTGYAEDAAGNRGSLTSFNVCN